VERFTTTDALFKFTRMIDVKWASPTPAMPNGRCRLHGGKSPGAPKRNRNAWKHGHYSAESMALRRLIRRLLSDAADLAKRYSPLRSLACCGRTAGSLTPSARNGCGTPQPMEGLSRVWQAMERTSSFRLSRHSSQLIAIRPVSLPYAIRRKS
jgi:hypothetical protein